jgi:hypothetical protein
MTRMKRILTDKIRAIRQIRVIRVPFPFQNAE